MLFSVTYTLDKEKREIINKILRKRKITLTPKKCLYMLLIICATFFFIWADLPQLGTSIFYVIIIPQIFLNVLALKEHKKADYKLFKRSVTFTLFEDRIEITDNPTEYYKGSFERAYPLSAIKEISDNPQFLIIAFDNSDRQFIMKSDLTEEQLNLLITKIKR